MGNANPYSDLLPCFIDDSLTLISSARKDLLLLLDSGEVASLERATQSMHALKGAAGLFLQTEIHEISAKLEVLLEVAGTFFRPDPERFEEVARFVLESLEFLDELTNRLSKNDTQSSRQIWESFRASVPSEYEAYIRTFESTAIRAGAAGNGGAGAGKGSDAAPLLEEIDPELLDCFTQEAAELFKAMDAAVTRLSADRHDLDALKSLSKGFHTLKGSAGMVGLTRLQTIAKDQHDLLESILDAGDDVPSECLTGISNLLGHFRQGLSGGADSMEAASSSRAEIDPELLAVFIEEAGGYIELLGGMIASLAKEPTQEAVAKVAKLFHTIKGSAGVVGFDEASSIAREANDHIESLLEAGNWRSKDLAPFVRAQLDRIREAVGMEATPSKAPAIQAVPAAVEPPRADTSSEDFEFFAIDTRENLDVISARVLALEQTPHDRRLLEDVFRCVHTIKGASSLVGFPALTRVAHAVEDLLTALLQDKLTLPAKDIGDLLFRCVDRIGSMVQQSRSEAAERDAATLIAEIQALQSREASPPELLELTTAPTEFFDTAASDSKESDLASRELEAPSRIAKPQGAEPLAPAARSSDPAIDAPSQKQFLRVEAQRLTRLMNLVGELITSRTRLSSRIERLGAIREELSASKDRLLRLVKDFQIKYEFNRVVLPGNTGIRRELRDEAFGQFSDLEFDRYDDFNILSRGLIEITSDVTEVMNQLNLFFDDVTDESSYFAKITSNMQHEVTQTRMVPASTLFQRLLRPIRDAARSENKDVKVVCVGEETELDKAIIDDMFDPLLHLVRNAVSHGIESPADRGTKSKPPSGSVVLKAFQEGNNVVIEVQDDGRGLDYEAIRTRGLEMGLIRADTETSRETLLSLIFRSGFSTRKTVSDTAGRGVGMDVVATTIRKLNGTVTVQSADGMGTRVSIRLPLTLAINQALMVDVHGQTYAIPLNFVEEALLISTTSIQLVSGAEVIKVRDNVIPLVRLATAFSIKAPLTAQSSTTRAAVIVRLENRRIAILVDKIIARQEIVVKSSGDFLRKVEHLSGGTIRGDGRVSFIVDVPAIVGEGSARHDVEEAPARPEAASRRGPERRASDGRTGTWLLVVDDSVSVRKVACRILESAGYQVDLAVDGLNALELLRQGKYDAVITDLEMPRVHGFELIAEIRRAPDTKNLPIIVITSRTGEKHVNRAMQLGANEYVSKPFTQEDLLSKLRPLVENSRERSFA